MTNPVVVNKRNGLLEYASITLPSQNAAIFASYRMTALIFLHYAATGKYAVLKPTYATMNGKHFNAIPKFQYSLDHFSVINAKVCNRWV